MLNDEQQAVVDCNGKRILCLAGAGTGKSFSMLSRIFRLIKDGVSPNSILVLTFTNAAAFEMKERFKKHNLDEYPEFRTFHSFCYHLISTDNDILKYFGYFKIPNVADEVILKRIKKEVEVITGIKLTKSSKLSMQSVHDASIFETALNKLLKQKNLITFDSLCYDVCKLFSDDSILIQKYKEKYKYIFVDEFQDTDLKQYQFVKSFTDSNLFVVGDALQGVYSFRNADSSIIKNLADDPEWVTFKLFRNYRSTKSICMYANKNSTYADDTYRVEIESDRLGGFIKSIKSRGIHRDSITDKAVLELIESTSAFPGSTAILCRTNALANFVKSYLNVDDALEFSHTTKLNIVKSALDEEYGFNWVLSMLSSEQYSTHIKNKLVNKSYCLKDVNAAVSDTYIRSIINKIFKIRCIINSDESVGLKILDILAALDIVLSQSTKINTIDEILMLEESENVNSSLHIGTIHSAKGLEYDNVIILGVNTESFRLTSEEENNLYYTAITRAKTNLYIVKRS